jgi:hypothetical protein
LRWTALTGRLIGNPPALSENSFPCLFSAEHMPESVYPCGSSDNENPETARPTHRAPADQAEAPETFFSGGGCRCGAIRLLEARPICCRSGRRRARRASAGAAPGTAALAAACAAERIRIGSARMLGSGLAG